MANKNKHILILGAGFAGLQIALYLSKNLKNTGCQIHLVDAKNVHIYTPDLYEIASNFHPKITEECLTQLKETVALPYSKILENTEIHFMHDRVVAIHPQQNEVDLKTNGRLQYDYLAITLGSSVNYYNIAGLQQFSYPLKTLHDAMAINCHLDVYFQNLWKADTKRQVSITIGGGGATGVELAAELAGYVKKLCKKYMYPPEHVEIRIIDASHVLACQDEKTTQLIIKRLNKLGVKVQLNTFIKKAEPNQIFVESKIDRKETTMPSDILIWTGGVVAKPFIKENFKHIAKNGALPVNAFLQNQEYPNIFAAGDNAFFLDEAEQKQAPMLAQVAVRQGIVLAKNIIAEIENQPKTAYNLHLKGMILPLGGSYGIFKKGNRVYKGRWVWFLRRLIDLWYSLKILPFTYALKKWLRANEVFEDNEG